MEKLRTDAVSPQADGDFDKAIEIQTDYAKTVGAVRTALERFATGVVLVAPAGEITGDGLPRGSELFGAAPRVFAAVGSGVAALVIIVGAVWSIARVLRGRMPATAGASRQIMNPRRTALANLLIATGTLVLSGSGTLAGRLGEDRAFAVTLLVGVVILFSGFLTASVKPI